jgi:hypothetical protein
LHQNRPARRCASSSQRRAGAAGAIAIVPTRHALRGARAVLHFAGELSARGGDVVAARARTW